jgi:hydrogenase maturation protein HypF
MDHAAKMQAEVDAEARLRISLAGALQEVGFRHFIYSIATELRLKGWVDNSARGMLIEVEGDRAALDDFLLRIDQEKPPRFSIQSLEPSFLDPIGYRTFEIRAGVASDDKTALLLPDIACCESCLSEIFDPANRRYLYPFTSCANCGPRFTIIEALPYDRMHTTMKLFDMCDQCRSEYESPLNRRFRAQANACPECGPHLELWDAAGYRLSSHHDSLLTAAEAIRAGEIVALKGLGGFHLVVDATNRNAVRHLRNRKHRDEKPFALMFPSIESIELQCEVSAIERRLLNSPESPIVLLHRRRTGIPDPRAEISALVAADNPYLGAMLPYTPLHHVLMAQLGFPIVATSGNLSDEPICTDEREAVERLRGVADLFLIHNRRIARQVDDSVVRIMMNRELVLRRARGYAPLPMQLKEQSGCVLAAGAHLKNNIAASKSSNIFVSQHIGDLSTPQAYGVFERTVSDFRALYDLLPEVVACDAHPAYHSTQFARDSGFPVFSVQHHHAHILSCMAENELEGPLLGVAWDGTGYGPDQTIWGGEFLRVPALADDLSFIRVAHLRTFCLPGGEKAIREPRRIAASLLYAVYGDRAFEMVELDPIRTFNQHERAILITMLSRKLNTPFSSSVGRLFDAVASIAGLRQTAAFEGQAAMELESVLDGIETDDAYPLDIVKSSEDRRLPVLVIDWRSLIEAVIEDRQREIGAGLISVKFHNWLVNAIVAVARHVGEERVVLTGGCFQNKYLTEQTVLKLKSEGFRPYWHQRVPPNDGGIALGQVVAAARALENRFAPLQYIHSDRRK